MATRNLSSRRLEPDKPGPVRPEPNEIEHWIADARAGGVESLGRLAERCRQYLLLVANRELDAGLQSKLGASDLVQETLLTAQQVFGQFDGKNEQELRLWLRAILLNTTARTSRSYRQTEKRDINREQPLWNAGSGDDASRYIADQADTPCRNAIANEQTLAIEQAINCLPEHYSQVIRLRCFDRQSFVEIGRALQISADAARKLWCRAIDRLRREWEASDESR
jgi:RNA polymerase sigma-70 factor, ECF subfamily